MIRWDCILFGVVMLGICLLFFKWWGIIVYLILNAGLTYEGGNWIDMNDYSDKYPPNTCSASIKDCKICNNEYNHEFNVEYERGKKWYNLF